MRGLRKKVMTLAAVAAMVAATMVGCGRVKNNEVVATVDKTEISAGVANFYVRYMEASQNLSDTVQMYQAYGIDEDELYKNFKESMMTELQRMYILKNHMADYNVTLTEEDNAAITKAADTFLAANSGKVKDKISAEKEIVVEVLELFAIADKMEAAMKTQATTLVKDEDIAQKAIQYVLYQTSTTDSTTGSSTPMTDEQKAAEKAKAVEFLAKAKENGNLEAYAKSAKLTPQKLTFDSSNSSELIEEIFNVANKLELNAFSDVVEIESGYMVFQLTSLKDEEATNQKRYEKIFEIWKEAADIDVNKKVWKKINLKTMGASQKPEEKPETETTTPSTGTTGTETPSTETPSTETPSTETTENTTE